MDFEIIRDRAAKVQSQEGKLVTRFVICISNDNPESLIIGKVYRTLPDADAAKYRI